MDMLPMHKAPTAQRYQLGVAFSSSFLCWHTARPKLITTFDKASTLCDQISFPAARATELDDVERVLECSGHHGDLGAVVAHVGPPGDCVWCGHGLIALCLYAVPAETRALFFYGSTLPSCRRTTRRLRSRLVCNWGQSFYFHRERIGLCDRSQTKLQTVGSLIVVLLMSPTP